MLNIQTNQIHRFFDFSLFHRQSWIHDGEWTTRSITFGPLCTEGLCVWQIAILSCTTRSRSGRVPHIRTAYASRIRRKEFADTAAACDAGNLSHLIMTFSIHLLTIVHFDSLQINKTQTTSEIDKHFFHETARIPHIKGKTNLPHIRGLAREGDSAASSSSASVNGSVQSLNSTVDKPWRHQKKEKKEKLRRRFVHLDQH